MKELSIEEKAKRYDEAIEKVEKWRNAPNIDKMPTFGNRIIEDIFPELKESEDEKVIRDIKVVLECSVTKFFKEEGKMPIWYDRAVAWLEKQSESNPYSGVSFKYNGHTWGMCARDNGVEILLDGKIKQRVFLDKIQALREMVNNSKKVEPKFKTGQWIVWQDKCYKVNYNGCGYELVDKNGLSTSLEYGTIDENAHLWNITKDAKDGDVLVSASNQPFIYSGKCTDSVVGAYIGISFNGEIFSITGSSCWTLNKDVKPATKEQRDTLEKAMLKAGYKWNTEERKLEKI